MRVFRTMVQSKKIPPQQQLAITNTAYSELKTRSLQSRNSRLSLYFVHDTTSSDLLPSKDAVNDRFQHTLDVLNDIMMENSNSQALELSIDMLNYI